MLQCIPRSFFRQRGVNRNTDVTRHHNGQIGHEPPCAIFGHYRNLTWNRQVQGFDVGCHSFGFREELGKRPVFDGAIGIGLGEEYFGGVFGALIEDVVGDDFVGVLNC